MEHIFFVKGKSECAIHGFLKGAAGGLSFNTLHGRGKGRSSMETSRRGSPKEIRKAVPLPGRKALPYLLHGKKGKRR